MHILHILEEASLEFEKAALWYEEKSDGLGSRFIDVIKKKLEIIQEHPERSAKRKGNFRESIVKTFPYVIVYSFYKREGIVVVNSIFHTSRSPKKKYKRDRH